MRRLRGVNKESGFKGFFLISFQKRRISFKLSCHFTQIPSFRVVQGELENKPKLRTSRTWNFKKLAKKNANPKFPQKRLTSLNPPCVVVQKWHFSLSSWAFLAATNKDKNFLCVWSVKNLLLLLCGFFKRTHLLLFILCFICKSQPKTFPSESCFNCEYTEKSFRIFI